MYGKETAKALREELIRWYIIHHRKLPWRKTKDPYKIWVSEVMLQQTVASTVLPYYERWLGRFPDMETLSRASRQEVLKAWEGLGYYQRATNLLQAARTMCRKNDCTVPDRYEDLIALPGFGPYTAAAVLSIAYGQPFPVLDANVRRVVMRLAGVHARYTSQIHKILSQQLGAIFPPENGGDFNQAMMELGALVCRPRNPSCLLCPIQRFCQAFKRGEQEVIPLPRSRDFRKIETVVGIIKHGRRYLIQKRPPRGLLAGLWEFPGGKKERRETLRDSLRRELREELSVEVKKEKLLLKVRHAYTRFQVTLFAFECELAGPPELKKGIHRWVSLRAIKNYPFPSGSAKIVRFLEDAESCRERNRSAG